MEILRKTNIDFIGNRRYAYLASGLLILLGIISLVIHGGPNYGIDFVGGAKIIIPYQEEKISEEPIRSVLLQNGFVCEVQKFVDKKNSQGGYDVLIRIKESELLPVEVSHKVLEILEANPSTAGFDRADTSVEAVDPKMGKSLLIKTMWAIFLSFAGIIVYVAWRFEHLDYGVAGVIALVHDVFVTVGIFSLLNKEITLVIVAALLTLAGYSINDTIVIFDRVRENSRGGPVRDMRELLNRSINQTLSRTIITALTVFIVLLSLFSLGGAVIHDFSFAFLFGCVVGAYSTIFVASPLVYDWRQYRQRHSRLRKGK